MNKPYKFLIDCRSAKAQSIHKMVDQRKEVKWETILKYIDLKHLLEIFPYYARSGRWGDLTLGKDWSVGFYKSVFEGKKCYYVEHSRIEYIFVVGGDNGKETKTI